MKPQQIVYCNANTDEDVRYLLVLGALLLISAVKSVGRQHISSSSSSNRIYQKQSEIYKVKMVHACMYACIFPEEEEEEEEVLRRTSMTPLKQNLKVNRENEPDGKKIQNNQSKG